MDDHYQGIKDILDIDLDYKTPIDNTSQIIF